MRGGAVVATLALAAAPAAAQIVDGTVTDGHAEVVGLRAGDHVVCSGVLVSPRVVVTAAHCADDGLLVGVGGAADLHEASWFATAFTWRDPGFDSVQHRRDFAALVLAAPTAIPPVGLGVALPSAGAEVTIVGFGHASASGDDAHLRRAGTATVIAVEPDALVLAPAPSGACHGDSGGAVLWSTADGPRLVGVIVAGAAGCAGNTRAVRIDGYRAPALGPLIAAASDGEVAEGGWCVDARSCAGGTCVAPADAPTRGYCAATCAADDDCPAGTTCDAGACVVAGPSPGALGAACTVDIACASERCAGTRDDPAPRCTQRCFVGSPGTCPAEMSCEPSTTATIDVCAVTGGGCQAGAADAGPAMVLLAGLGAIRRAPRRRA